MPEGSVARRSDPEPQQTPCTEAAAHARGFVLRPSPGPELHPLLSRKRVRQRKAVSFHSRDGGSIPQRRNWEAHGKQGREFSHKNSPVSGRKRGQQSPGGGRVSEAGHYTNPLSFLQVP